jgi:D-alanyl-D-alanine carboxypeptidase (penicillin-binding protein 5/6)
MPRDADGHLRLDTLMGPGEPDHPPAGRRPGSRKPGRVFAVVVVLLLGAVAAALVLPRLGGDPAPVSAAVPTSSAEPSRSAAPVVAPPKPAKPKKPSTAKLVLKKTLVSAGPKPSLPWPSSGQAQVEIPGIGSLGHSGASGGVPIASVTKVMTAYTVLRDHPLGAGQSGPTITVSPAEAAAYPDQKAQGLSLVVVAAGEKLTERQALKGLLIASGDNMAEILARWDAGSVPAFVAKMNANARRLGMSHTHYVDPNGVDPGSVSSAADLLRLAPKAMAQPTLAQLAGTASDSIPLNPTIHNPNSLLGLHGVYGIKTGTTTAAGGCLLFAAHRKVNGETVTIYGAVLGISGERSAIHSNARDAGDALVVGAGDVLHKIVLVRPGQTVATLTGSKGDPVRLTVAKGLSVTGWSGQTFRFSLPGGLRAGKAPTRLIVHTPTGTRTLQLVRQ